MGKRKTRDDFLAEASEIHGVKYSYDKVEYNGWTEKVTITCPKHGDFQQTPSNHVNLRHGCPDCAIESQTDSLEEFIEKARKIHGDKYSYDKSEYKGNDEKVTIVCPIHGDFDMTPHNHKAGQGCPHCARERNSRTQTKTIEKFIVDARRVHGDKYNYDKVEYIRSDERVTITCPIHGDFPMTPNNHTSLKHGCPHCAREMNREAQTKKTEEFIAEARNVHGNKYSYDKVRYVNAHKLVTITCPVHGDFPQLPTNHLGGSGCFYCKASHLERETRILLEQNDITFIPQKKFDWLKSHKNGNMSLDFYLPDYNIGVECQGIQHYKENGMFTEERVNYTRELDELKARLCKEHGVNLYYIKYDDVENDTRKLLEILSA